MSSTWAKKNTLTKKSMQPSNMLSSKDGRLKNQAKAGTPSGNCCVPQTMAVVVTSYCQLSISSTPENPEAHARRMRGIVDGCAMKQEESS